MASTHILCPDRLETGPALDFAGQLAEHLTAPDAVLDFSRLTFARPYGTLLVAESIKTFVEDRKDLGLPTRMSGEGIRRGQRREAITYLGHVGFFGYIGIDYGLQPGVARGSDTYLPLTLLTREEVITNAPGQPLGEAVNARCKHIASLVFADDAPQLVLQYCLREIVRNVFEHSQTDSCCLMAQKYSDNVAEIAISDRGIGVYLSLRDAHPVADAQEALRLSLQPGITRSIGFQTDGRWDNTGFGLYTTSELGRERGSFTITSSGVSITRSLDSETVKFTSFSGTAVRLRLSLENAEYFPNVLHNLVEKGEKQHQGSASKRGSSKKLWF